MRKGSVSNASPGRRPTGISLRLLLVEGSEDDAFILLSELRRYGYEVSCRRVETAEEMTAALEDTEWDVVVSDYYLPDFGALEALRLLEETNLDLPFVVVSGKVGEDKAVAAMKAGAHDYVSKNDLARLGAAIERELRQAEARGEKRRAEEALRESEEHYRLLAETATDGIVTIDEGNKIRFVNRAAEEMFGYTGDEMLGREFTMLMPERLRDVHRAALDRYLETGRRRVRWDALKLPGLHKSGREIPLEVAFGEFVGGGRRFFTGFIRDTTERQQAEEDLRRSEERYRAFVQRSTEGIWRLELEAPVPTDLTPDEQIERLYRHGYLAECNDAMARMHGLSQAREMVGARLDAILPPSIPENVEYLRSFVRAGYLLTDAESQESDGQGGTRYFSKSLTGLLENGSLVQAWGTQHDTTERKRVERHLNTQYAVARALEESATLDEASSKILQAVCEGLRWDVGVLWRLDRQEGVLRFARTWYPPSVEMPEFDEVTQRRTFSRGVGLLGGVWASGEPAWVPDVVEDDNFLRAPVAAREGLHGAFAFPILLRGEVLGILEFFCSEVRQPDETVLEMMGAIGAQIGQLIERKRAEEELRKSEEQYRSLVQNASDIITILEADGAIRYQSPAAERVLGYRPEDAVGTKAFDGLHPDDRERALKVFAEVLSTPGIHPPVEFRVPHADGSWRHLENVVNNLLDDPFVEGIVVNSRDVTERKRAEEELRKSEERTRAVVANAPVVLFALDREGVFTLSEGRSLEAMGLRPGQVVGMSVFDVYRDEPEILAHAYRVLGGEEFTAIHELAASGLFFETRWSPMRDRSGAVTGAIVVATDITERKRSEEALRRSEERFRATFEQAAVGMAHVGLDGRWLRVNRKLCEIVGYPREELLETTFGDLTHPDDLDADLEHVRRLLAGEANDYSMEKRYVRKDGSIVWANLTVSLARKGSGEPDYFISVVEDVTERKRVEEARLRLATIVDSSEDAIIGKTLGGVITNWNRGAQNMYGYRAEEVVGKPISILAPPERADEIPRILEKVRRGEPVENHETLRIKKDGGRIHVSITVSPIRDPAGNILGASTIARDVTERKRTEQALRESERLHQTVVEQAAENIFLFDAETKRILKSNTALCRTLGYTEEELRGMTLYDIVDHDRESIDRNIRRVAEERKTFLGERKYRRKDGSTMDVEVSTSTLRYDGREAQCVVAHDVTERRQTEERLRRSLDMLLALREAGRILGSTLDSEEIETRLLEIMRSVFGLTTAVINVENERGQLRIWRSVGLDRLRPRARFSLEAETARRAAWETGEHRLSRLKRPDSETGSLTGLSLPLKAQDRIVGVLEAFGPETLAEEETVGMLNSLAAQAASALENAQLYRELAENGRQLKELVGRILTAQEEERRRIAFEVHDGLAQLAAAAHHHLQAFARFYPPSSEEGREILDQALDRIQRTVREARRVIADLRPRVLDDYGLQSAIRHEVEALREEGWHVDYEGALEQDERLPTGIETTLFRVTQEALRNVRKHADTKRAHLALERNDEWVRLSVQDWGNGFDPAALSGGGPGEKVGLSSMRERVSLLGGRLEIRSRPGTGTLVTAEIPLRGRGGNGHRKSRSSMTTGRSAPPSAENAGQREIEE